MTAPELTRTSRAPARPLPGPERSSAEPAERPTAWTRVQQVLVATLPFGLVVLGYSIAALANAAFDGGYVQGARSHLGFALHVIEPVRADQWLFSELPTHWLQEHFTTPGQSHWYDAVVSIVYLSHFVVGPGIAVWLWFRDRARFKGWVRCVLALAVLGLATYLVYPMAPPWLAAESGVIEPVSRLSHLGWDYLGLDSAGVLVRSGQGLSNPVAAMPSLHVGLAVLCVAFLGVGAGWRRTILLAAYPAAMALAVVYAGEHYVLDALVGAAYAVAVVLGWRWFTAVSARRALRADRGDRADAVDRVDQAAPAASTSRG